LVALARQVTQEFLSRAVQRGDDLGFEPRTTQSGTRVTVRVGPCWVEVEDGGPGIATEHQAHVFERFYRAAPASVRGSGLGLAIAREIAKQHGAQLSLRSPLSTGPGTVFRMAFPPGSTPDAG
ncbi:ATP-binding protein, partial [Leptospira sp. 96542]|nr:ATP-binding protein [Leptospira sp. 96542]